MSRADRPDPTTVRRDDVATRAVLTLAALLVAGAVGLVALPRTETPAERVDRITAELRCPVCQGLAVSDSPAETARQMRDLVAQRVADGKSDAEIRDEFRASYGEWVFLSPPASDARAFMWLVPLLVAMAGLLAVLALVRVQLRSFDAGGPAQSANSPSAPDSSTGPTEAERAALAALVARDEGLGP
jgi:cytochrome c-type biogenesis protein CcmH